MPRAKKAVAPEAAPVIAGIKGFDASLRCRDFQFEVGKTYKHEGSVVRCENGFHAVTDHPLAVFGFYPPAGSRFCRVTLSGCTDADDTKTAAEIIEIGEELSITGLVQEAVAWVRARAKPEGKAATGNRGAASATGNRGAAMASGFEGRVMGAVGNALFAVERAGDWSILSVAAGIVGQDGVEAGVWYVCRAGRLEAA